MRLNGRRILRVTTVTVAIAMSAAAGTMSGLAAPVQAGANAPTASPNDSGRHWVTAYSASMQGPSTLGALGVETPSGTNQLKAVQDIIPPPTTFSNQTVRQVHYLHYGGDAVRIQLSNRYGTEPTTLPSVTVGKQAGDEGAVQKGTVRTVAFDGSESVTIPPGKTVLSDPVDLSVKAFDHLVTSIFVPDGNPPATVHGNAMQTFFMASGDQTAQSGDNEFTERGIVTNGLTSTITTAEYYVSGIQVDTNSEACTLVALGDSITDGVYSEGNTDTRYPDVLARRLLANPNTDHLSVTSQAISGGRVLHDGIGPSTLDRLKRDVLEQPNVCGVVFLQGINDIGTAIFQGLPANADQLIQGYRTLADRLHTHGIPVFIGTLTPSGNLLYPSPMGLYSTPKANETRDQVNQWIRTKAPAVFDGVIDFDKAIRSPLMPNWLALKYNGGDNLHPNSAGYKAMATAVPLHRLKNLGSAR